MPSTATSILDGLSTSVAVKAPCRAVATSNITLSGLQTISGYTTVEGDRVLVKGQSTASDNGIYDASTGSWTRSKDADGNRDLVQGTRIIVRSQTIGVEYELTTANPIVIGTTALVFELRYGANATFDQTEAEILVNVTPQSTAYPPKDPRRYGAEGDGATNDTAAFTDLESAYSGEMIDLQGLSYEVTTEPTANIYYNGSFVVDARTISYVRRNIPPITSSLYPLVVDMQAGALRGVSFAPTETDSSPLVSYTLASGASAGATSLTLTGGSNVPVADELIAILGTDGEYYSVPVLTVSAPTVNLRAPLPVAVSAGANAWKFYTNEPHPNVTGYYAIADYALRELRDAYVKIASVTPSKSVAGVTLTEINDNDTFLPCSANVTGWEVTPSAGDGALYTYRFKRSGQYLLRIRVNTGGSDATILANIGGFTITNQTVNKQDASVTEIPCWVADKVDPTLTLAVNSASTIPGISKLEIWEYTGQSLDEYETKKHAFLGDSWIAQTGIVERFEERLPNAQIINAGVGGDDITDLLARFSADVAGHSPDFVHIVVGTNDQYAAMAANLHSYYMQRLLSECFAIGAIPVIYTSSVRSPTSSATRFDLSRQYYESVVTLKEQFSDHAERMVVSFSVEVPDGATRPIATLGRYIDRITVYEHAFFNAATGVAVNVLLRYGTGVPAGTTADTLSGADSTEQEIALTTATRFVDLGFVNASGGAIVVTGFIVANKPDAHI